MTQISKEQKAIVTAGAFFGFTGVLLGAFGAHGLKKIVAADLLIIFETGCRYHLMHALALLALAGLAPLLDRKTASRIFLVWSAGIVIFSGSLYALVMTGARKWGMVTPIGGLLLIAGWLLLLLNAIRWKSGSKES